MRQLRHLHVVLTAFLALALGGCAVGNTHTFNYRPPSGPNLGQGRPVLVFAVQDAREYVVSGDEPATFVGEQRGGFGTPFNVLTTDKRPFAVHVQETLRRDLEAAGFKVIASQEVLPSQVAGFLQSQGAERGLAVTMREFNSNTYNNIDLEWDFEAVVYGTDGAALARNSEIGAETLEGSLWNPPQAAKERVPPFFYALMHRLVLGDEAMARALAPQ